MFSSLVVEWGPLVVFTCGIVTLARMFLIAGKMEKSLEVNIIRIKKHSGSIDELTVLISRLHALPKDVSNLNERVDEILKLMAESKGRF